MEIDRQDFEDLVSYLKHDSWRCNYYEKCHCGLDDLTDKLLMERVPRTDPRPDLIKEND
jgi:hypothetical protein